MAQRSSSDVREILRNWDAASFCREHGIESLALFGSAVTDQLRSESDIDVLVRLDRSKGPSMYDLLRIQQVLQARFGRRVDVVEEAGLRNPFRRKHIMSTRRVLYEAR